MPNARHKFKWLVYKGDKVRIDKDIAPLISNMWELGIGTTNSCQGVCSDSCKHKRKHTLLKSGTIMTETVKTSSCDDRVWIAFDSARSLERFLNIVAFYEKWERGKPDGMYELIQGHAGHDVIKGKSFRFVANPDNWEVHNHIPNLGVREHVERFPNDIPGERKYYYAFVEDDCPRNNFRMQPQLKFPRKHLAYVEERVALALQRKKK